MFDTASLADLSTGQLLAAAASNKTARLQADNELLLIAAAWADDQDRTDDPYAARGERSNPDGDGDRPQLDEDAVCELGAVLGLGFVSTRNLIGDAIAIRYRLPRLWELVRAASVPAWQVRKIAEATSVLSWDQAADVDAQLAGFVGLLPWPRLQKLVAAAVVDADPDAADARAERARTERFVRSFQSEDGLKTLVARATSGDVTWFMATINRIADILKAQGDTDPVEVLRSRAVGILAHPAEALRVLAAGTRTGATAPDEPVEPAADQSEMVEGDPVVPDVVDPAVAAERSYVSMPSTIPADIDPRAAGLRPRTVLYFHLSDASLDPDGPGGLVRPEHGSPLSLGQLHDFLSSTGCQVTVRPVITPADQAPVDGYEIPGRLREAVRLRNLVDVFPYGSCDLQGMDLDHTVPYDPGGPPGQTGLDNLGPLSRTSHRAATPRIGPHGQITGRWHKRQPVPGTYLWRSPHGWIHLTTNQGTLTLGTSPFAQRVWAQACAEYVRAA